MLDARRPGRARHLGALIGFAILGSFGLFGGVVVVARRSSRGERR